MKNKSSPPLVEYYGSIIDSDPADDILYWQSLSSSERFAAGLEISMKHYYSRKTKRIIKLDRSFVVAGEVKRPVRNNG